MFIFSHPSGRTMQLCAPKGQGSLFDMGCTKSEGFGAAQHGGGSWEHALRGSMASLLQKKS
eukprot:1157323-Pelagomonas_calceolata.AAC.1